jgi:hypothetical protein
MDTKDPPRKMTLRQFGKGGLAILLVLNWVSCSKPDEKNSPKPQEENSHMMRAISIYSSDFVGGQIRVTKKGSASFQTLNGAPVSTIEGSESFVEAESGRAKAKPAGDPALVSDYTAKQAYARLIRALRNQRRPMLEALWLVHPQSSYVYDVGRNLKVGSWTFYFKDKSGVENRADVTCQGEVQIESGVPSSVLTGTTPMRPEAWVVDSSEALARTVSRGAAWYSTHPVGGWLVNIDIQGAGTRPVWVGNGGFMQTDSATGAPLGVVGFLVDATTGEIYGMAGRDRPHRVLSLPPAAEPQQATGGSNSWQHAHKGRDGRVVYDEELLRPMLMKERARQARDASSWSKSGVIEAVLGDWLGAGDDLDRAVSMQPANSEYRYYRSVVSIAVRDFDAALSDLRELSPEFKAKASEGARIIGMLKDTPTEETSFVFEAKTNGETIPIEVWIGTQPLTRPKQ